MDIRCFFPVIGQSGWEYICRNMVLALHRMGVNIQVVSKDNWNIEKVSIANEECERIEQMLCNSTSPTCSTIFQQFPDQAGIDSNSESEKRVCLSLFETDKVPQEWKPLLNQMDEVWVFSEFNQREWGKQLKTCVKKIPIAIDTTLTQNNAIAQISNKKEFNFLTIGDYTERKNFEGLLEAYIREFTDKDDVALIMKVHYSGFQYSYQKQLYQRIHNFIRTIRKSNLPKVLYFGDKVSTEAMPLLYRAGDCLVLPTHGEGLGLPLAEALACAVPCITTGWGGQMDFLNKNNSYLLPYHLIPIEDVSYIRKCPNAVGHKWAQIEVKDIQKAMRHVFENREEAKQKALIGQQEIEKLTFENQARWVIRNIYNNPYEVGI